MLESDKTTRDGQESARMAQFLLSAFAADAADAVTMARQARLPAEALRGQDTPIGPQFAFRLWELAEARTGNQMLPLSAARGYRLGELELFDYLFTTAATLRDGMAATSGYLHLLTTNTRLAVESETGAELTYAYRFGIADGRGAELAALFAAMVFTVRAQAGTGEHIAPVRVALTQPAPRGTCRAFTEAFGTRDIEFGAPATSLAFRQRDLDRPMRGADPVLARVLRRYADGFPPPPEGWRAQFRALLTAALDDGAPSIDRLAARLAVSRRTLQRKLAEHGTTWRTELERARHARVLSAEPARGADVARRLGYTDARSVRRLRARLAREAGT